MARWHPRIGRGIVLDRARLLPDALTVVLLHGFPSSVAEFEGVIERLTQPESGPAFDVVVPSLPGYGLSSPLSDTGWTMGRMAQAVVELMQGLGV